MKIDFFRLSGFFARCSPVTWLMLGFALLPPCAIAQSVGERSENRGGEGETHLVLSYSCKPENRAAFRAFMEGAGADQFEQWKQQNVMKGYLILFSSFVNEQLPDMWVMLDFEKFADVAKWQEVERTHPGGLAREGLAFGTPKTCAYTDVGWRGGKTNNDLSQSVFMLIPYLTLVPVPQYEDYVDKYILPQLRGWVKAGIMPSYAIHLNQNPANAPWHSLLVFEYDGMRGIALRDTVKNSMRAELKGDAGYQKYSPIKTAIRKELEPATYVAILPKK